MALLKEAGSFCEWGTIIGVRKAPKRGLKDSPHHASAVVASAAKAQPSSLAQPPHEALGFSLGNSSRGRAWVPSEEELAMIASRALLPSYKDLASTLVHLTSPPLPGFMRGYSNVPEGNFLNKH